jgi:hypothetical protein
MMVHGIKIILNIFRSFIPITSLYLGPWPIRMIVSVLLLILKKVLEL